MTTDISSVARALGLPRPMRNDSIDTLLTDSRSLTFPRTSLFFAIPTKENDGHRYVRQLYDTGVRNFVVNRVPQEMEGVRDANFLVVPDTVGALQQVARRLTPRAAEVVAITGSAGKTTIKEWLFQMLEPTCAVTRSPRSYNSRIGVPLSLWEVAPKTDVAIIEAGVSHTGEMQPLAEIIDPDTVIFTNLGPEHSHGFASPLEKAREKALLARAPHVRTLIYCTDSELIAEVLKDIDVPHRLSWSRRDPQAPIFIEKTETSGPMTLVSYRFKGESHALTVPFISDGELEDAFHALAYLLSRGIAPEEIAAMFTTLHPIATRLNVSDGVNGCTLIYDSYTSDYSSLLPALDFLRRRLADGRTSTVILSDLRHESRRPGVYGDIARLLRATGIRRVIGVGPEMQANIAMFGPDAVAFSSTSELLKSLSTSDFQNETILIKGAPEFGFERLPEMLEARKHETVLEVNLDAVVKNFNYFRSHLAPGTGLIAMVKASGYGAGSYEIAKTLQAQGAAYLAVAVLDEGIELRQRGITMPIIVMNPKVVNYRSMFAYRLEPEIYSMEMLRDVAREAAKNRISQYPLHIKLDTGMHRMGFVEEELPEMLDFLATQDNVTIASVFSHLATADCPDMDDYTLLQLDRFKSYTDYIAERWPKPFLRHVLNSAGILRFPQYGYDLARLGIGLYGANTLPPEMERPLANVSTLRTVIIALRHWRKGETIGYGRRGVLERDSVIATIPIGYADGMNRHFGNGNITVLVGGKEAPTVGNICMDACMIDVTGIDCHVGDAVEIFGPNMSVQRLADVLGTIPYEVLTSVSPRVKRVYYRE